MTERKQAAREFEERTIIRAAPDAVFDFVADVRNMPRYLPTTRYAEPQEGDRVRVQGEAAGHGYDADGFLRAHRQRRRLEWGSDEHNYSGHLDVRPHGDDASEVAVHLSFQSYPQGAAHQHGPSDADIREGLRRALRSIEHLVTGTGGKEESGAAR
jgi:uncharacterized protein YndB with AHSA1/START domain